MNTDTKEISDIVFDNLSRAFEEEHAAKAISDFIWTLADADGDLSLEHRLELVRQFFITVVAQFLKKRFEKSSNWTDLLDSLPSEFWFKYGFQLLNAKADFNAILKPHMVTLTILEDETRAVAVENLIRSFFSDIDFDECERKYARLDPSNIIIKSCKEVCDAVAQDFKDSGMTHTDAAIRLGVTRTSVSMQLSGKHYFSDKTARRYANVFGYSYSFLREGKGTLKEKSSK